MITTCGETAHAKHPEWEMVWDAVKNRTERREMRRSNHRAPLMSFQRFFPAAARTIRPV